MANDFDYFPTYDPLTRDRKYISPNWETYLASFIETLSEYLTQNGIFVPKLTTVQRDALTSPVEGQMIYLTDLVPGTPRTAALQIWQVVADVGSWVTIV
jgi:hypothetical protein